MSDNTSKLQAKEQLGRGIITASLWVAAIGALVFYKDTVLPFLTGLVVDTTTLAVDMTKLGLLIGGIMAVVYVLFLDPRTSTLLKYIYASGTRALLKQFVDIDAIGVLNTYKDRLTDRLKIMDKHLGGLKGQRDDLEKVIGENEHERVHQLKLAEQAMKQSGAKPELKKEIGLKSRQAGRLENSNVTLSKLFAKIDQLYKDMMSRREAADITLQDITAEIDVRTREQKALYKGYNVMLQAQRFFNANDAERGMYDMALERLTDDYAQKMGEIETFIELSKSIVNGIDLDNGIYEENAVAQIDAWNKSKQNLRVDTSTKARVEDASPDSFSHLYDGDSTVEQKKRG